MFDPDLAERVLRNWNFADPAGSAARFEREAAAEPDPVRRQALLTQLARAHGLQGAFADGHAVLDALGDVAGLAAEPAVRCLLERGRLHNSAGDPAGAAALFRPAFDRAQAAGLIGLAADAAHMLAIALPAQSESWAHRGMALAADSPDPLARTMLAALANNLAWAYAEQDRWDDALPLFERAVELRRERGDPEPLLAARWSRARALRALGRSAEALAELRELAATPEGAADHYVAEEIEANERALAGDGPVGTGPAGPGG